jgi:hypothetical protein
MTGGTHADETITEPAPTAWKIYKSPLFTHILTGCYMKVTGYYITTLNSQHITILAAIFEFETYAIFKLNFPLPDITEVQFTLIQKTKRITSSDWVYPSSEKFIHLSLTLLFITNL